MLKEWIRKRKLARLSVDLNDPTMRCPARQSVSGLMSSAHECLVAWKGHFETDAWRADAKRSMRAVSAIHFHWAEDGDIVRPETDVKFSRLEGIKASYQYFALREGEVLMRSHSCWCPACFDVAVAGPAADVLSSQYKVVGCEHAANPGFYEWRNASCRAETGGAASSPDARAKARGHALARAGLLPGQWVLVEAYEDPDDELWLGKLVPFGDFNLSTPCCCKEHRGAAENVYGTRFNKGDFMVSVQWYERVGDSGDGERREFTMGEREIDVINSTELRSYGFDVKDLGSPPSISSVLSVPASSSSSSSGAAAATEARKVAAQGRWLLSRRDEAEALPWCR